MSPGATSPIVSLQWESPQCESMWWSDEKEQEVEQLEHYEESWDWGLEGVELITACSSYKWPAPIPGAVWRSQPSILLRAVSESTVVGFNVNICGSYYH